MEGSQDDWITKSRRLKPFFDFIKDVSELSSIVEEKEGKKGLKKFNQSLGIKLSKKKKNESA